MVGNLQFELHNYAKHRRHLKKILNNTKSALHDVYRSGYFTNRMSFSASISHMCHVCLPPENIPFSSLFTLIQLPDSDVVNWLRDRSVYM